MVIGHEPRRKMDCGRTVVGLWSATKLPPDPKLPPEPESTCHFYKLQRSGRSNEIVQRFNYLRVELIFHI